MLPYHKYKTIDDIYGEKHYIKESFFDKKFDVEVYLGRPVANTRGRNKFIITRELESFILKTSDLANQEFNGGMKKSAVIGLRRVLKDNPFQTYSRWKESKRKDKPKSITIFNARDNPEIIKDYFGNRFVILSAIMSEKGVVFPMGILEGKYLDAQCNSTKKYILTSELAQILEKNRFYPSKILKEVPFNDQTLRSLRAELGYSTYTDRNTWLAQHIQDILSSTAREFCLKHADIKIQKNVISDIKTCSKFILTEIAKKPQSSLLEKLNENWKVPSEDSRVKVDRELGIAKSKKVRRTFSILKEAKFI